MAIKPTQNRKTLHGIVLIGLFFAFGTGSLPSVRAQEPSTETLIDLAASNLAAAGVITPLGVITDGNNYFLQIDLQDPRISIRVGLANSDNGGLQSLSGMATRYSGKGYLEWAIINGDLFSSNCPYGVNCAQGLTYIDGNHISNWSAYGTTWPVRGNIGFDSSKGVQIAVGDGQTKRNMTIAGGPWIVTNGGVPTCSAQYIDGKTYFSTGEQFDGDARYWCTDTRAITLVGYSSDHRYLFMGVSSGGENVIQLAQWLKDRGAYEILRLDSGGSSGIIHNGSLAAGSSTRAIANHLAVIVQDSPPPPPGNWNASYFDNLDHWWDPNNNGNLKCTENFSSTYLDKNYGSGAPCSGMDGDTWVGDYTATINFSSGNYVFRVEHDDGLKLWLNGQNIADRSSSGADWMCPARSLSGNTTLRVILREDGGDAKVKVSWTTDTSVCTPPPGSFNKSSPANGATGQSTSLTLQWGTSSSANSYEYCYDTTNDNACSNWMNNGASTSKTLNGLNQNTTYYWHVRAINGSGTTYSNGSSTAFWSFATGGGTGIACDQIQFDGVTLFENKYCNRDQNGNSAAYSQPNGWIDVNANFNDITSSIYVKYGWSIKVFEHSVAQGGGSWRCINGSMWDLSVDYYTNGNPNQIINDTISSIQVYNNNSCYSPPNNNTLTVYSNAAYDGWVIESTEFSNVGSIINASSTTFNLGDNPADRQYRSILSFNTSSLPDNAVITKVTLKIKKYNVVGTDPFITHGYLWADIRKGFFGTYLLQITDFQATASKNGVGRFWPVSGAPNWYQLGLGAANYTYINLTGTTQFRLRFAKDDNDDRSADYMTFYSGNYGTVSDRPTLIIEYYVP